MYIITSFSAHWGNIATKGSPTPGLLPTLISNDFNDCSLHAFEQFGALYIYNHDEYPARRGFEPGTSRLQALVDTYEPSGPALYDVHL